MPHIRFLDRMAWFVAALTVFLAATTLPALAQLINGPAPHRVSELIVLYKADSLDLPATAEHIVLAVKNPSGAPANALLASRLQNPRSARLLLRNRLAAASRASLPPNHPLEILHRYVVLTYTDPNVAEAALQVLRTDPNVISVEENAILSFAAFPGSPLANGSDDTDHQWGLVALNAYSAWDKATGHGYIGVVDNGVQSQFGSAGAHPELLHSATTTQPWFGNVHLQFSRNYGIGQSIDERDFTGSGAPPSASGGHGTHVAGLIAGTPNNNLGGSGLCWFCTLMIVKANVWDGNTVTLQMDSDATANAISFLSGSGAQALNISAGAWLNGSGTPYSCSTMPNLAICNALLYAQYRDVVVVAAAGNWDGAPYPQFPANDARSIAVGGVQRDGAGSYNRWHYDSTNGSGLLFTNSVVAPAKDIYSSFYTGQTWNGQPFAQCGDNFPATASAFDGLGWCTGTSMAAPQVTGLIGVLRSINPLLSVSSIRNILTSHASNSSTPNTSIGVGIPNARGAVDAVLQTTNRLTPLFAFAGNPSTNPNHFYTTVPQMGSSALSGDLLPYVVGGDANRYSPLGAVVNAVDDFNGFPSPILSQTFPVDATPRAQVWIFTTAENPIIPSVPLVPLYRLSYSCSGTTCSPYANHIDHTYTTEIGGIQAYEYVGYTLDGIEGYIYPNTMSQPTGAVRLYRMYNAGLDDHAIFPESEYGAMYAAGYTVVEGGHDWIGWVYPNTTGNRPTY